MILKMFLLIISLTGITGSVDHSMNSVLPPLVLGFFCLLQCHLRQMKWMLYQVWNWTCTSITFQTPLQQWYHRRIKNQCRTWLSSQVGRAFLNQCKLCFYKRRGVVFQNIIFCNWTKHRSDILYPLMCVDFSQYFFMIF